MPANPQEPEEPWKSPFDQLVEDGAHPVTARLALAFWSLGPSFLFLLAGLLVMSKESTHRYIRGARVFVGSSEMDWIGAGIIGGGVVWHLMNTGFYHRFPRVLIGLLWTAWIGIGLCMAASIVVGFLPGS